MASNDPKSSAYTSPNGVNDQQRGMGAIGEMGKRPEESPGEKIGRFFRKAMDRISGHDEGAWRRGDERNERDREMQEPYRASNRSSLSGRPEPRDRGQSEWSDLGRSRDDRSGSVQGPSFENRGRESLGQRALGRSPSESYGIAEVPSDRPVGSDRGFLGDQGREDWNRRDWSRSDHHRDRWEAERGAKSSATGRPTGYSPSVGSSGFAPDEERVADWGETARDRDRGQGRRFWQREPLAARDVMTRNPRTVSRQSVLREAAAIMRDENCGVVPVVDASGRLEGILTDRDIVVRGVAHDRANELHIEDVMTDDVSAVTEDEPLTSVLDLMGRKQIRRVPVVDRDDRLLGIISMADIANRADYDEDLQDAFERISSRRSFWSLFS